MRSSLIAIALIAIVGSAHIVSGATAKPAVQNAAPARLQQFDWSDVTLNAGPLKDAFEANLKYLRSIEPDRLLLTFRRNAGIESSAQPYGGWEEPKCELRGHTMGHYLSACARAIAQTNDPILKKNADYTVAELAKVQAKLGHGYLSAFPAEFFDRVEAGRPVWAPYYTIHKIMLGLWEMHAYAGNAQALDILKGMADYFKSRCDKLDAAAMQKMLRNEFGGMHEVLLNLYSSTGEKKYLDLAQRFVKNSFIDPLADGKDDLPGIHANTHIPQIAGQARAYELTGNAINRKVVEFFYNTLVSAHSYATGGSNVGEYWGPPNKLANTLAANNQEFCTSYNFEKICRYLLRWTGDARYANMIERLYYNGILVSQDPQTGMLIYFLPMKTGLHKDHGTPFQTFTCCYGTGMQEYNSLAQDIYYHSADTLYVNLFAPSTVKWNSPSGLVTLTQVTDYPASAKTTLKLSLANPATFKLALRSPWWAENGVAVKINGEPLTNPVKPWITLDRQWADGDTVEMTMPMSLKLVPMPDDPKLAAIMYGPMVLAGLVDGREIQTGMPAPILTGDMANPQSWIKPVEGKPLTFRTVGQPTDLTLIPIHKVINETYGLYWHFASSGSPELANYQSAIAGYRARASRIIDNVLIGDTNSERAHALRSQNSQSGNHPAGAWRHAGDGGFFSYRMRIEPQQPNVVAVTYWGSDAGSRTFDILVDGTRIATQTLNRNKPEQLFVVEYPIPQQLTANKQNVVIRFQPTAAGQTAGGIFGLATLLQQAPTTQPAIPNDLRIGESDIPNLSNTLTVAPCSVTLFELKTK